MAIDLGSIKARITADASGFEKGLKRASRAMKSFGKFAARSVAAAGAVGAAATAASVKLASDFERSLESAGAKANATAGQLRQMEQAALSASGASEFSARNAAEAMGFLAQAGFSVNEQIQSLEGTLQLASAGELELANAADIASNVLSGFGKQASKVGEVNDVLVKTANSANTSVQQLGQAMSFAAPAAKGAGVSMQEAASVIGTLSNAGIQAGRAGRSFNAILGKMGSVAGDLGAEMTGAQIEALGFTGSLEKLQKAGLSSRNAVKLFGRQAGPAVQAALNQGIGSINELTASLNNAGGTAQEVADKKIDTLSGAMNVLQGNVENVAIKFGQSFLPVLKSAAQQTGDTTASLVENQRAWNKVSRAVISGTNVFADIIDSIGYASALFIQLKGVIKDVSIAVKPMILGMITPLRLLINTIKALGHAADGNFKKAGAQMAATVTDFTDSLAALKKFGDATEKSSEQAFKFSGEVRNIADGLRDIAANADVTQTMKENRQAFEKFIDVANKLKSQEQSAMIEQVTGVSQEQFGKFVESKLKASGASGIIKAPGAKDPAAPGGGSGGKSIGQRNEVARLARKIATETNKRKKAELELEKQLLKIKQDDLTTEERKTAKVKARLEAFEKIQKLESKRQLEQMREQSASPGPIEKVEGPKVGKTDPSIPTVDMRGPGEILQDMDERRKKIRKLTTQTKSAIGAVSGLGQAFAQAAGASDKASQAISKAGGIMSQIAGSAGAAASGNIFGAVTGGIGALTSIVGLFGGGGMGGGGGSGVKMSAKELGEIIADRMTQNLKEQDLRPIEINFDARGSLAEDPGSAVDMIEDEMGNRFGGRLGGLGR